MKNKNTLRIILAVGLSLLSGAFLFLSYPPVNFWPLAWIAIIPYLIAQHRLLPQKYSPLAPTITNLVFLWPFLARIFCIPDAPFFFKHMGLFFSRFALLTSTERKFHELTGYR